MKINFMKLNIKMEKYIKKHIGLKTEKNKAKKNTKTTN